MASALGVAVAPSLSEDEVMLLTPLMVALGIQSGRYCQVELVGSESKVAEKTLLRAKPFDAQHQYPCDERIEASAMSPIFLPSWLGERWSKCTSVDPATLLSTIWGSVSVSAVPGNGQDLPTANGLLLRKLGDVPWVPTTEGLRCVRATGQKSSMDFMDFPAIIGKSIGQMVMVNSVFTVPLLGRRAIFRIEKISGDNSADALRIALFEPETTAIELGTPVRDDMGSLPESLGGYEEEADELAGLIETAFYHSQAHERLGISPVRAVLLSGPSGVGKSFAIDQVVQKRLRVPSFQCRISEIAAANRVAEKDGIPSEEVVAPLVRCIEKAKLTAPAVVILDGIELLDEDFKAPNFDRSSIASYISSQIQRIGSSSGVCVIASAIDLRRLPKSLQRNEEGGGFDRVIEMSVPDRRQREMILRHLLAKIPLFMDNDLEFLDDATCIGAYAYRVSQYTAGFLAKNLEVLVAQAAQHAVARHRQASRPVKGSALDELTSHLSSFSVNDLASPTKSPWSVNWKEDFQYALSIVGPAQVGFESKKPSARWEHVGGYDKLKTRVRQLATWPLQRPEAYVKLGVKPPAGLLLYGPSGCGKTLLVHALAASCPMNYISVKGSEIYSKYLGESESMVRKLFAAARRLAPCLLFMDELDAIGTRREWSDEGGTGVNERVLSTLLNEMDGVQERKGVFIIACTTRPEKIDDALLRPGRLDHHLYIPLPTVSDRRGILESLRGPQGAEILGQDVDIGRLAELTEGYSGADLSVLVRESGVQALRSSPDAKTISWVHVQAALDGAIRCEDNNIDPFAEVMAEDSEDEEEFQEPPDGAEPILRKIGWWRPAWIDREQIMGYEKFCKGREEI